MQNNNLEIYKQIHDKIDKANSIAILSHKDPDGDAIGSSSALFQIIKNNFQGKKVDIINKNVVSKKFAQIPHWNYIIDKLDRKKYDLFIILDTGAQKLLGFFEDNDTFLKDNNTIVIDHHVSNDEYCNLNFIDPTKGSVGLIIYDMVKNMGYKINEPTARALLFGIYSDTGALAFSSVKGETFIDVAEIVRHTDELNDMCNNMFFDNNIDYLKILGIVFERFKIVNNIGISYIRKEDLNSIGATLDEDSGISGHLNSISSLDYVMFFYEKDGGIIKCSIRTPRNDFDLTEIAKKYGGGGHKKAAGFSVQGELKVQDGFLCFGDFKLEY
ncbi:MAG: DHH family phosphoesterase [Candidatus Gracilibacteria bacterium]|nr:DHH family phosphoesterase [Candidatus Gracilibacteria bacterium]MDD4530058.1 DHH family phosphoesterase [Candidatus Gracilibacteria bacterium]